MIDAKRKAIIFLTISFLLAVAAAGVILVQINDAQKELGEMVQVAAAAKDIQPYEEISVEDIDWVELPATSPHQSFIKNKKDLENSISLVEVETGELLTKSLVREKLDIPPNERVVWLNATETVLIDQDLAVRDLVDIIAVYQIENGKIETKRILSNVPVVDVGSSDATTEDAEEEAASVQRVKIALPIEDATKVIHHQNTAIQIRVLRVNQANTGN